MKALRFFLMSVYVSPVLLSVILLVAVPVNQGVRRSQATFVLGDGSPLTSMAVDEDSSGEQGLLLTESALAVDPQAEAPENGRIVVATSGIGPGLPGEGMAVVTSGIESRGPEPAEVFEVVNLDAGREAALWDDGGDGNPEGVVAAEEVTCNGLPVTIADTDGDDFEFPIYGTEGDDIIHGKGGRDVIYGLGGDDTICSGPAGDILIGGPATISSTAETTLTAWSTA